MKLLFAAFLLLLFSCGNENQTSSLQDSMVVVSDTVGHSAFIRKKSEEVSRLDTTMVSGNFLHYFVNDDSTVSITWGNKNFRRTQNFGWSPDWFLGEFSEETRHFIILQQHCGFPCWTGYALPHCDTLPVFSGYMSIAVDSARDRLLAFSNQEYTSDSLFVYDLVSQKKQRIVLDSVMQAITPPFSIDKVAFCKNSVYIRWQRTFRKGESGDEFFFKEKTFPLSF